MTLQCSECEQLQSKIAVLQAELDSTKKKKHQKRTEADQRRLDAAMEEYDRKFSRQTRETIRAGRYLAYLEEQATKPSLNL